MRKILLTATIFFAAFGSSAMASEYCVKKYESGLRTADVDLAAILKRQVFIDAEIPRLQTVMNNLSSELIAILGKDPNLSIPANRARVDEISKEHAATSQAKAALELEGLSNRDRAYEYRVKVPAKLQGELNGCAQAVAPANSLVNLTIQTIALISTAGASTLLPQKTLYVDMGEVLHGKPLGGDDSFVVRARDDAMRELGINPASVPGVIIRRPECIIIGLFKKCD